MAAPPTTSTAQARAAAIAEFCKDSTPTQDGWMACCPAHDDNHPSLSIGYTDDRVLVCCFAGCSFDEICAALGFKPAEMFCGETYGTGKNKSPITDTYDYTDEHGTVLFQVCRTLNKDGFPQRRPDPSNPTGFAWGVKGIRRVLYHLPDVLAAVARGEIIYIAEGEKDVDNLRALGLTATCNPGGASKKKVKGIKWLEDYSKCLRGATCVLLPDHDEEGETHMQTVARSLHAFAASVKIVPGIHTTKAKSDVSDWLAEGHTRAELEAAVAAAPLWTPTPIDFKAAAPPTTNGMHPPPAPNTAPPLLFDPSTMYTDTYNGRALVRDHGTNLRYCSAWKSWLIWTGTHWKRDSATQVMELAKQTIKDMAKLLHGMDPDQCKVLLGHIARSLSTAKLEAMVKNARSVPGIPVEPDAFDRNLWLLNCQNGTIDLRNGDLREADREDYLTKCLSITYNAQAICPKWEEFLSRAMDGKQGLVAFLHRAIGYSLTGSTMEQCLFILHGPTKTGKSTFLNRLKALLGPYSTQADMESFMHKERQEIRNDLADLAGARVVCALEAQEGKRLNESLIKQLTGGVDQVKARFLFQDYFTYTPQFKVFLGTNHKPVIKDNDQAIWERIRLVPFIVQIPKNDRRKTFDAELHEEIEGILAWAVRGCLAWQQAKGLGEPPEVLQATKEYQEESDLIGRFLIEKATVDINAQAPAKEFYDAYKAWCEESGERWETLSKFGARMTERGFERKQSDGIKYLGIKLKPPGTQPPAPATAPPSPPEPGTETDVPF